MVNKAGQTIFDSSNYAVDNPYNIKLMNKKMLFCMKDETAGIPIERFVGVRPKCYCVVKKGGEQNNRCKGIKCAVAKTLTLDQYQASCEDPSLKILVTQHLFKCVKHVVYTTCQSKVALNSADEKRYICTDLKRTLPWGHSEIPAHIDLPFTSSRRNTNRKIKIIQSDPLHVINFNI